MLGRISSEWSNGGCFALIRCVRAEDDNVDQMRLATTGISLLVTRYNYSNPLYNPRRAFPVLSQPNIAGLTGGLNGAVRKLPEIEAVSYYSH